MLQIPPNCLRLPFRTPLTVSYLLLEEVGQLISQVYYLVDQTHTPFELLLTNDHFLLKLKNLSLHSQFLGLPLPSQVSMVIEVELLTHRRLG